MPITVQLPVKKVIIDNSSIKNILISFDEALESQEITSLQASEAQMRNGFLPKLANFAEGITDKPWGSQIRNLPPLEVQLDDPADLLRRLYRDDLNALIIQLNMGLGSQHTESEEIQDKFTLVREILLRLVTKALSKNQEGKGDGDKLIKVIEIFLRKINSDNTLYDTKLSFWEGQASKFNSFFTTDHKQWLSLIQEMISTVKLLNQNTTAMSECLTHLKQIQYSTKCLIIAQIDPNRKYTDLSEDWIDMTLKEYEETIFQEFEKLTASSKNQTIVSLQAFEKLSGKQRTDLICQSLKSIRLKKTPEKVAKIAGFYEILHENKPLEDGIKLLDRINTTAGWLPFTMGLVKVDMLAERIKAHSNKCAEFLTVSFNDPIFKTSAGKALIKYDAASSTLLKMGATRSYDNLMKLQNKEVLTKIAKFMESTLNGLLQLQPELGFKLLDEDRLIQLTQSVLQFQPQASKYIQENDNQSFSVLKAITSSEDNELGKLQKENDEIEMALIVIAKKIMEEHSSKIKEVWKDKDKQITPGFILSWAQRNKHCSKYHDEITKLQSRKTEAMRKLEKIKQSKIEIFTSSQRIVRELNQQEFLDSVQNISNKSQEVFDISKTKTDEISEKNELSINSGMHTLTSKFFVTDTMQDNNKLKKRIQLNYKEKPEIKRLTGNSLSISCLLTSPDDRLICGFQDESFFKDGLALGLVKGMASFLLATATPSFSKNYLYLWDAQYKLAEFISVRGDFYSIKELFLLTENKILICASRYITILGYSFEYYILDLTTNKISSIEDIKNEYRCKLAFPDETILISESRPEFKKGSADDKISLLDLKTKKLLNTFEHHDNSTTFAILSPDAFASSQNYYYMDGKHSKSSIKIWKKNLSQSIKVIDVHGFVEKLKGLSDTLLAYTDANIIRIWDIISGKCKHTLVGHTGPISALVSLPNNLLASSSTHDGTIRIWNSETGNCEQIIQVQKSSATALAAFSDGRLASSCSDGCINIYTFPELKPIIENKSEDKDEASAQVHP